MMFLSHVIWKYFHTQSKFTPVQESRRLAGQIQCLMKVARNFVMQDARHQTERGSLPIASLPLLCSLQAITITLLQTRNLKGGEKKKKEEKKGKTKPNHLYKGCDREDVLFLKEQAKCLSSFSPVLDRKYHYQKMLSHLFSQKAISFS